MAIKKSYRGKGAGASLIKGIRLAYVRLGITSLSLSVHKKNRAFQLYSRLGFEIVYEEDTSVIMKLELLPLLNSLNLSSKEAFHTY